MIADGASLDLLRNPAAFVEVAESLAAVEHLVDLPDDGCFHLWPRGELLARRLDVVRYVAVAPRLFTWAVLWGRCDDESTFVEHWCYPSLLAAVAAAACWDGAGEPVGWIRHPRSGRRRPDGDATREFVAP